jgi:NAD(P)-dependent dehydrogenase (short-subunit alcohol dehydrogenase family)
MAGKVVVVTGSTRGIGRAIVTALATAGHTVVVSSRSADAVDATVAEVSAGGGRASGIACDVSREADLEALLAHTLERHGRLDVWVNNAGISTGYRPLDELGADEARAVVDINLTGTVLGCRLAIAHFREHDGGQVINMTGRGYRGDATPYTAVYAATKAAVVSLTRSLAAENRSVPVSVNAVVPGMVATDFYVDIECSPRLETTKDNWRYALDAFGVPLAEVAAEFVRLVAMTPGAETGRIYSLLTPARTTRGVFRLMGHRMSGRMKSES